MSQFLRPLSFVLNQWNGAVTDIDETIASDTDFVYTNDNPNSALNIEFTNSGISDPEVGTGHIIRWRKALIDGGVVASSAGTGCDLDVELWQGQVDTGTLIAAIRTADPLDSDLSWTADSYTLTEAQANAITDYNDLHFHFHGKGGGGAVANRRGAGISWLEMEIPDPVTRTMQTTGKYPNVSARDLTPDLGFKNLFSNQADVGVEIKVFDSLPVIDQNDNGAQGINSLNNVQYGLGINFWSDLSDTLDTCMFSIKKVGSPTGNLTFVLYNVDGNSLPTGTALATSNTKNVADINSNSPERITLTFPTPATLTQGTEYFIAVEYSGGDASNYLEVDENAPTNVSGSSAYKNTSGVWADATSGDLIYLLETNLTALITADSSTDAGFSNVDTPADTHPFNYNEQLIYTVQAADELSVGTYYYIVRGIDVNDGNVWGSYTSYRNFSVLDPIVQITSTSNGIATVEGILTAKGSLEGSIEPSFFLEQLIDDATGWAFYDTVLVGQKINSFNNKIYSTQFLLRKTGSPVHDIVVRVYSISGGVPDQILETSSSIVAADLTTSYEWVQFDFSGANYNQDIALVLAITNITESSVTNRIEVDGTGTSVKSNENRVLFISSWNNFVDDDLAYKIEINKNVTGTLTGIANLISSITGQATVEGLLINGVLINSIEGASNGIATVSGTLTAKGSLESVSNGLATILSELIAKGFLESVVNGQATVEGLLIAKGILESAITGQATVSGTLSAKGQLEGSSDGSSLISGDLTDKPSFELAGLINALATVNGILTAKGLLSGSINASTIIESALTSINAILGASNGIASVSGTLTAKGNLIGSVNAQAIIEGILVSDAIEGSSNGVAIVNGLLTALGNIIASSDGSATVVGTLTAKGNLSGVSDGSTTTNSILKGIGVLQGVINSVTTVEGVLVLLDELIGEVNGLAVTQGTLTAKGLLQGIVNGVATTQANLVSQLLGELIAETNGLATIQGTLTGKGTLSGVIDGYVNLSAELTGRLTNLLAQISGIATVTGDLTYQIDMNSVARGRTTIQATLTALGKLEGIINAEASVSLNPNYKKLASIINGIAEVRGFLNAITSIEGSANGSANVSGTLRDARHGIKGTSEGFAIAFAELTAKSSLNGLINGTSLVKGTLIDRNQHTPFDDSCIIKAIYIPNPNFTVTYEDKPIYTVTFVENKKYVVTFNCQKSIS